MLRSWTDGIDLDKPVGSNMNDPGNVILMCDDQYFDKDAASCLSDSLYLSRNSAVS